ncbi:NAD(P)-dependent oxidoreductase [Candidatus Fermentibacteria bacterium]|nr:NAD(P)-dependent oxidoreductase [Candidatus Fermentibacteria bacterium]
MRVLVTGASGFLGRHACRALSGRGVDLVTLDLPGKPAPGPARHIECNPAAREGASRLAAEGPFDCVVHLAGATSGEYVNLHRANVLSVEAVLAPLGRSAGRMVLAGSSAVYGRVDPSRFPVGEDEPPAPVSPYGLSMARREEVACRLCGRLEMSLCTLRLFNLAGPGQEPVMLVPSAARQLAMIEAGLQPPVLRLGSLAARRDYVDARDAAEAFAAAVLEPGVSGVLNISSGVSTGSAEVVAMLAGFFDCRPEIDAAEDGRPAGVEDLPGNPAAAFAALGWAVSIPLEKTLADIALDWKERVAAVNGGRS